MPKRMSHRSLRVFLLAALLAAAPLWLPAGAAEGPSIAVLDVERVLRQSKAGQSLHNQIADIRARNQAKGREAEDALLAEDRKLQAQRAVLSAEAFAKKSQELQSELNRQRQAFEERRRRFQAAVDKAWFEIRAALLDVTGTIAEERQIDVVVSQSGTALMSKELNISKEVLTQLDAKLTAVTLTLEDE